jgi:nucleotide-binding universal stress UspA family protein
VRRILVGYDGSAGGRRALTRAIADAQESHAHITVLSVFNVPLEPDAPRNFGTLDDISDNEGARLSAPQDVVAQLTDARDQLAKAGLRGDLMWAAGPPADVIVETARGAHADVIVVGEHHHGFLARAFGADVGAAVQREASCEVVLA